MIYLTADKPYTVTSGLASDPAKKVFDLEFGSDPAPSFCLELWQPLAM